MCSWKPTTNMRKLCVRVLRNIQIVLVFPSWIDILMSNEAIRHGKAGDWMISFITGSMKTYKTFGEGNGNPLQYSWLENSIDGGAWKAAVHGVTEGRTPLSDFTFTFSFMHWRRKWWPTLMFLPGESQGRGSLVWGLLWSRTESHTTEVT